MNTFAHGPSTLRLGDLEVCRLGFGAMQIPGPMVWGEPKDPERARAVLRRAVALGINLIDTAWFYGPLVSNRFIAETLRPYPKDLVIATKLGARRTADKGWVGIARPEELREGCEEDLRSLGLERLDVVHLRHNATAKVPFAEALDTLIALKTEGKIRHVALSNVTMAQLRAALAKTPIVAVQNLYNVAAGERQLAGMDHAVVAEQEETIAFCEANGIAYLPFFPLAIPGPDKRPASKALTDIAKRRGKSVAQIALAWLLARSTTMLPIPGTSSPEHLEENWESRTIELTADERRAISEARA